MANFPTWINKNKATTTTSQLSPRQVANKAYSLAIKKLDKDDQRRRPHYSVRERLLLSNTMAKAEDVLNKRTPRTNRRALLFEDDDVLPPAKKMAIAPPPPLPSTPAAVAVASAPKEVKKEVLQPIVTPEIKNESPIVVVKTITTEQKMAVSLAVAAAAVYSNLSVAEQQFLISSPHDYCRPIMIPTHSTMNSITTII